MTSKTMNDNEDRRVLDCFYTQFGTKLFVENGVLVEQKLKPPPSKPAVLVDPNLISVPSPTLVGDFNPVYSRNPPPPRKERSPEEIKKLSYERSIKIAQEGLAYYNRKHPKEKYVLVRPIESNGFMRNGFWFHCVFLAKPEDDANQVEDDVDSAERCFFAEVTANGVRFGTPIYLVTFCRPIDGTQATLGCEACNCMPHPLSGFLKGNPLVQPRLLRSSRRSSVTRGYGYGGSSGKGGESGGGRLLISGYGGSSGKGGESGGGRKKQTFCLKIQDLHKYIPNFDDSENDWMQYM